MYLLQIQDMGIPQDMKIPSGIDLTLREIMDIPGN